MSKRNPIRAYVVCSVLALACSKQGASHEPENANTAQTDNTNNQVASSSGSASTTGTPDDVARPMSPSTSPSTAGGTVAPQASWSEPSTPAAFSPNTTAAQEPAPATLNDQQIAKITEAVSEGEVAQGKVAEKKATNKRVKRFAAHMVSQHTQAKKQVETLAKKEQIEPAESSVATDLESKANQTLATLESADGKDFDRQYIDAQVTQHQQVYDLLNAQLIPNASNADLKNRLQETRTMVEKHLNEAREIQSSMASAK